MSGGDSGGTESVVDQVDGASNVLLSAPTLSPDETATCTGLLDVADPGEMNVLAITYKRDPDRWLADFRSHFEGEPAWLRIVSVSEAAGESVASSGGGATLDGRMESHQSPRDLTGLGITISEFLRRVEESKWDSGATHTVICFDSVTAMVQYVDPQRAFRFFHIVTSRVSGVGATAHYHIHPDAMDDRTVSTLQTLFDALVRVGEDGVEEVVAR